MNGRCDNWPMLAACAALCVGCARSSGYEPKVPGGDPTRGRVALERYQCGVCHVIPGVRGAVSHVGPPLHAWARHSYIAGKYPNVPELLVRWIPDAPSMAPLTAMPAIAMSEQDAADMAAYLYQLK